MQIIDLKGTDLSQFSPQAGCIYRNLPNELYHGLLDWLSSSGLKKVLRSVEYFYHCSIEDRSPSIALERGSAFHSGVEGLINKGNMDQFEREVKSHKDKTIATKDWHQVKSDNPGCYVIPAADRVDAYQMAERAYGYGKRLRLWINGHTELSFFWIDAITGIKCKVRTDFISFSRGIIVDHKSTKSIDPSEFKSSIFKYNYDLSAGMYIDGVLQCSGVLIDHFLFNCVNNTAPFETAVYEMGQNLIKRGISRYRDCLEKLASKQPEPHIEKLDIKGE